MREKEGLSRRGQPVRPWVKAATVLAALALVGAAAGGCREQQLEERNLALQRQLEESLLQNSELQRQLDMERQRVAVAPTPPPPGPTPPAPTPPRPRHDFGPDVEVREAGGTMTVTLPDRILFASGSATLKPESAGVLDRVAAALNRDFPGHVVRVEGHTDNDPITKTAKLWKDNWELSCERALSVLRHLMSRGVDAKRVSAAGYAYYRPIAPNTTVAGRAKNRRVEVIVAPR